MTYLDNNYNYNYKSCVCDCSPTQVINFNIAINDFSLFSIFDSNSVIHCNECLKWSYSIDGINWSCWLDYNDAAKILFEYDSDYYVKVKVNFEISKIEYNGNLYDNWDASLAKCFEFDKQIDSANSYNPYANMEYAIGLYNQLSETVSSIVGIPIYYFKLSPNINSKDITFKEYSLMNVECVKQIKMIVRDGEMPSSRPDFTDFGLDFSTDWECEISKLTFASAFGDKCQPMEGDLIYVPMMKRMWMVNTAYDEKKDGLMWQSTVFKIGLVKYQDKGSVDLGDTQNFVDSLVKKSYEDLFGNEENIIAGRNTVESPTSAFNNLYPVFESDAIRKYVKMSSDSDPLESINTKLVSNPKYHSGMLVSENAYNWRDITEESYIIYQKKFIGNDATISFIIDTGDCKCEGTLLKIGTVDINIKMDDTQTILNLHGLSQINLEPLTSYLVIIRYSKQLNIIELKALKYTYPTGIPLYLLQKYNYNFDLNNPISVVSKYDMELEQCNESDIIMYSFDGKISNIKIYNTFISEDTELIQMLPSNKHLLVNDVCRKFVTLRGVSDV